MQQRSEPHDSLDDFPTPPWATRAVCEHVLSDYIGLSDTVWEPCCNRGYMAKPLSEYFDTVYTSDIHDYGWKGQQRVVDFLFPKSEPEDDIDWIFFNPPFRLGQQFIERALDLSKVGVVCIVRSAFLEGVERYETLFKNNPPSIVAQHVERVPMVKGRYDHTASSATSYSWLVWIKGNKFPTKLVWIPPSKKEFERKSDYQIQEISPIDDLTMDMFEEK